MTGDVHGWFLQNRPEEFKELIDALFRFDWSTGLKVVSAFSSLLSHLVSANGTCMVPAMHMLVRKLVLSPQDMDGEKETLHDISVSVPLAQVREILYI